MRNGRFRYILLCALFATSGCRGLSQNWNGTWKLNVPKSSFRDQAITISISPGGEYRYDDGFVSHTFLCDGRYQSMGNNRTQACVKSSITTLDITRMENGVRTNTYRWDLSVDGKILTMTATAIRPTGPVFMGKLTATRISGSNDFAGQWMDTSFLQPPSELTVRLDAQYLHINYPSLGNSVDAPLNGSDASMQGRLAPDGVTYSVHLVGQGEISILKKRNGEPSNWGSLKLSDDGKVLIESWWVPSRLGDKSTFVYDREMAGTVCPFSTREI
jgi:hypothetical protein